MAEFTGESQVPVFDMLTLIVMLEQCEPDLTVVTYWQGKPLPDAADPYAVLGAAIWGQLFHGRPEPPTRHTTCMTCLLRSHTTKRTSDGRAELIKLVRAGEIQIEAIALRSDTFRCPRCQAHIVLGRSPLSTFPWHKPRRS